MKKLIILSMLLICAISFAHMGEESDKLKKMVQCFNAMRTALQTKVKKKNFICSKRTLKKLKQSVFMKPLYVCLSYKGLSIQEKRAIFDLFRSKIIIPIQDELENEIQNIIQEEAILKTAKTYIKAQKAVVKQHAKLLNKIMSNISKNISRSV